MYILVNKDNIIVGSSNNKICEKSCSQNGYRVFEIEDSEYSVDLIGTVLTDYDVVDDKE